MGREDQAGLEKFDWITSKTSSTQIRTGRNGERWMLKHPFVNANECLGQWTEDDDKDEKKVFCFNVYYHKQKYIVNKILVYIQCSEQSWCMNGISNIKIRHFAL